MGYLKTRSIGHFQRYSNANDKVCDHNIFKHIRLNFIILGLPNKT